MIDRVVSLPGVHNLRDLGGLPTADGGITRRGVVFRSEFLSGALVLADPRDGAPLGLTTVVDLRRSQEIASEQAPWEEYGVTVEHRPLRLRKGDSWRAGYEHYLTSHPETFAAAIASVISPVAFPVLFHCAAGKDRTGVVAAFVLDMAGVPDDVILADYQLTIHGLQPIMERLADVDAYDVQLAGTTYLDHLPDPAKMRAFLDWLHTEWHGARSWLTAQGLTDQDIDTFLDVFVERSGEGE